MKDGLSPDNPVARADAHIKSILSGEPLQGESAESIALVEKLKAQRKADGAAFQACYAQGAKDSTVASELKRIYENTYYALLGLFDANKRDLDSDIIASEFKEQQELQHLVLLGVVLLPKAFFKGFVPHDMQGVAYQKVEALLKIFGFLGEQDATSADIKALARIYNEAHSLIYNAPLTLGVKDHLDRLLLNKLFDRMLRNLEEANNDLFAGHFRDSLLPFMRGSDQNWIPGVSELTPDLKGRFNKLRSRYCQEAIAVKKDYIETIFNNAIEARENGSKYFKFGWLGSRVSVLVQRADQPAVRLAVPRGLKRLYEAVTLDKDPEEIYQHLQTVSRKYSWESKVWPFWRKVFGCSRHTETQWIYNNVRAQLPNTPGLPSADEEASTAYT